MSWIFSFLLACYALVRLALWLRGQMRWLALRRTLPPIPPAVAPPSHLTPKLAELFTTSRELRANLAYARRSLTAVEATDPDAPLGQVRDRRYRRALMESWTQLQQWIDQVEALQVGDQPEYADLEHGSDSVARLRESLRGKWKAVASARALDPFALDDLVAVRQTLEQVDAELAGLEARLSKVGEHPYRDRFAA